MARAVLLALACAGALAAAAGARYSDYSGAIMPHYGGDYDARAAPPALDYREHPPDASAHLDYKYEEVSSDKIDKPVPTDAEEDSSWNKPVKKPMNEKPIDDVESGDLNKYKLDKIDKPIPTDAEEDNLWNKPVKNSRSEKFIDDVDPALNKYKLNEGSRFQTKYRGNIVTGHQNKYKFRTEDAWSRRDPGRSNQQMLHDDEEENYLHPHDAHVDSNLENEEEKSDFAHREIKPKVRRKARDRPNSNTLLKAENDEEENLSDKRDIPKTLRGSPEYREVEEPAQAQGGRLGGRTRAPGSAEDADVAALPRARKQKPMKSYNEYADYYDMQRVQSMKKKIPERRKKARRTASPAPRRLIATRHPRRAFRLGMNSPPTRTTRATLESVTSNVQTFAEPLTPPTRTIKTMATPITTATATAKPNPYVLSVAEKSRLSILKKVQRKESSRFNGTSTFKPPVLFLVTQKMETMVMVEPAVPGNPWMRAKEVSDDSPERLKKVKRLMRQKLVANANDIRNLTENWNELVCDYVDVALLDSDTNATSLLKAYTLLLLALPVVCLIF